MGANLKTRPPQPKLSPLILRFLWASAFHMRALQTPETSSPSNLGSLEAIIFLMLLLKTLTMCLIVAATRSQLPQQLILDVEALVDNAKYTVELASTKQHLAGDGHEFQDILGLVRKLELIVRGSQGAGGAMSEAETEHMIRQVEEHGNKLIDKVQALQQAMETDRDEKVGEGEQNRQKKQAFYSLNQNTLEIKPYEQNRLIQQFEQGTLQQPQNRVVKQIAEERKRLEEEMRENQRKRQMKVIERYENHRKRQINLRLQKSQNDQKQANLRSQQTQDISQGKQITQSTP